MEASIKNIISVQSGEKATRLMQEQNKLSFIVSKSSNKISIKKELETLFSVKVDKINVINKMNGDRIAIVKLKPENNAMDLATKLGLV
ncbi:MAG: 50S ribosomal protein L23 [Candidatus Parvarchaeota archaeon]|jgi:Ribosomal protein L23|nr:50S ribosomal protein L23 [Candidatus Parvarchaeota archaeon]MCL5101025.1 50S ribosomal protein L23 [Candidatus Parvarchaeota archaeon]